MIDRFLIPLAFTMLFSAASSLPAQAGDKINNGGGIWACEDGSKITKGFLIDLFEAQRQFEYKLIQPTAKDPFVIVGDVMSRLQRDFSDLYVNLNPRVQAVKLNARFRDIALVEIPDANNFATPYPADCKTGAWQKVQFANYRGDGELFIRKDLWEGSVLTPLDKAGLILHEAVYLWLRTDYQDQDSTRARRIVGLILSTLPMDQINTEVRKVLWDVYTPAPVGPTPTPSPAPTPQPPAQNFLCLIENPPLNTTYGGYGEDEFSARTSAKMLCNQGPSAFSCSGNIECGDLRPSAKWTCSTKNNMTGQLFLGQGRTQFEAQFHAQQQCQSGRGQSFACESRDFMDCASTLLQ